jgi:hypothetical protein
VRVMCELHSNYLAIGSFLSSWDFPVPMNNDVVVLYHHDDVESSNNRLARSRSGPQCKYCTALLLYDCRRPRGPNQINDFFEVRGRTQKAQ